MKFFYFISLLIICFYSCQQEKKQSEIIVSAEKIIENNPDSTIQLLLQIEFPEKLKPKDQANYWYLISLAHSLTGRTLADIPLILYSFDYYKKNNEVKRLGKTYQLAATYYDWNNEIEKSSLLKQEGLDFSLKNNDSLNISQFYYMLGEGNLRNNVYSEAINYFKKAINYNKDLKPGTYYLMGLCYANMAKKDSTDYYMKGAIELASQKKDTLAELHFCRNYADILFANGFNKEAIVLMKQLVNRDLFPSPKEYITLSKLYLSVNEIDSAQLYLNKANSVKHLDKTQYFVTTNNNIMLLQALINHEKGTAIDWGIVSRFNDSVWVDGQKNKLLIEEKINAKNLLEKQNLGLIVSKQRAQIFLFYALLIVLGGGCFIFFYIRRKRAKLEDAEEKQEVLQMLLNEALTENTRDRNDLFFKKVLLQQLGLIRLVATSPTAQNQELLRQMSLINNNNIQVDALLVWDDLYNTINSIYNNFYTDMVNNFCVILGEKEIQLCCLLRAEFSTKEISVVTQQSVRTIYQRKTTIRQKLGMNEKNDIIDFILKNLENSL